MHGAFYHKQPIAQGVFVWKSGLTLFRQWAHTGKAQQLESPAEKMFSGDGQPPVPAKHPKNQRLCPYHGVIGERKLTVRSHCEMCPCAPFCCEHFRGIINAGCYCGRRT